MFVTSRLNEAGPTMIGTVQRTGLSHWQKRRFQDPGNCQMLVAAHATGDYTKIAAILEKESIANAAARELGYRTYSDTFKTTGITAEPYFGAFPPQITGIYCVHLPNTNGTAHAVYLRVGFSVLAKRNVYVLYWGFRGWCMPPSVLAELPTLASDGKDMRVIALSTIGGHTDVRWDCRERAIMAMRGR